MKTVAFDTKKFEIHVKQAFTMVPAVLECPGKSWNFGKSPGKVPEFQNVINFVIYFD